jgi:hypothetical protein
VLVVFNDTLYRLVFGDGGLDLRIIDRVVEIILSDLGYVDLRQVRPSNQRYTSFIAANVHGLNHMLPDHPFHAEQRE